MALTSVSPNCSPFVKWFFIIYCIKFKPSYFFKALSNLAPICTFSSVQSLIMSDSLWSHELQHSRPPCPSPAPAACSDSCPLSWWCHPTILSSVVPSFSHLQSFPASGSFPMSQFFTSGGPSIGVSASASVLPMNIQDWFPLGLTGCISLQSKETSLTPQFKSINCSVLSFLYSPTLTSIHDFVYNSHIHTNHSFD